MEIFNKIYFNFYATSSFILAVFYFVLSFYFLSIVKKSKAIFHLGIVYTALTLLNIAYFACCSIYDPAASYHRWFTVTSILIASLHMNIFLIYYPDERNASTAKSFIILQYIIILLIIGIFIIITIKSDKIFLLSKQYWDFNADTISKTIGLIILLFLIAFFIILIWRIKQLKNKERFLIIIIGLSYLAGILVPSILNAISRNDLITRDIYHVVSNLVQLFSFFILTLLYIYSTKHKIPFITKISSICIVLYLVVLQISSYYIIKDSEEEYNRIHKNEIKRILKSDYRPLDITYILEYSLDNKFEFKYTKDNVRIELNLNKNEFINNMIYEKIKNLPDNDFNKNLENLLNINYNALTGYKLTIIDYVNKILPTKNKKGILVTQHINNLREYISYQYNRINQLSDTNFRIYLQQHLNNSDLKFKFFNEAILSHLARSQAEGKILKAEILEYLSPMNSEEMRNYRQQINGKVHYVAFSQIDLSLNKIYEVGFSYVGYREYIHSHTKKLIVLIGLVIIISIISFPLFFPKQN